MAKMGLGPTAAPAAAMAVPRPMPNPRLNPGAPPQPQTKPAGGGLFPNMGIQKRFDMAMDLLKNGMQMAGASGNPMAAFLAPLAGAAIGGGIENKRAKMMDAQGDELMASMLPGANQDDIQQLSDIVSNPDAPDYLKSIAKAKLDAAIKPYMPGYVAPGAGGGGGASGGSKRKGGGGRGKSGRPKSTDVLLSAMFESAIDPEGDGGESITPAEQARIDALKTARSRSTAKPAAAAPAAQPIVIDGYTIEEMN